MIINGVTTDFVNANDRGLMYGDGVFRTLLLQQGKLILWSDHYKKLQQDCTSLGLACPTMTTLSTELDQLIAQQSDGVIRITITRGTGTRGYAPPIQPQVTRILNLSPLPSYLTAYAISGVKVHLCNLRLAHQPRLAGVKHLNRLENVLAAAECQTAECQPGEIAEGLLLDTADNLVEGTRSNLFLIKNGTLYTPDLSLCGVAGLQRERVMNWATQHDVECKITNLKIEDLLAADEVFLVNSVIGLWPVREIAGLKRENFPISLTIQDWLNHGLR